MGKDPLPNEIIEPEDTVVVLMFSNMGDLCIAKYPQSGRDGIGTHGYTQRVNEDDFALVDFRTFP